MAESNVKRQERDEVGTSNGEQLKTKVFFCISTSASYSGPTFDVLTFSRDPILPPLLLHDGFVKTHVYVSYADIADRKQYGKGFIFTNEQGDEVGDNSGQLVERCRARKNSKQAHHSSLIRGTGDISHTRDPRSGEISREKCNKWTYWVEMAGNGNQRFVLLDPLNDSLFSELLNTRSKVTMG